MLCCDAERPTSITDSSIETLEGVGGRVGRAARVRSRLQGSAKRSADFVKQQPGRARQKS